MNKCVHVVLLIGMLFCWSCGYVLPNSATPRSAASRASAAYAHRDVVAVLEKHFNRTYLGGYAAPLPEPSITPGDQPHRFRFEGTYVERRGTQGGALFANVRGTVDMKTERVRAVFTEWAYR